MIPRSGQEVSYDNSRDGESECHQWWKPDPKRGGRVLHRENGPARIILQKRILDSDFWVFREEWFFDGFRHRENGPDFVQRDWTGQIVDESWTYKGRMHRIDGPAVSGIRLVPVYGLYGINCTQQEFERLVQLPRLAMLLHLAKIAIDKSFFADLIEPLDKKLAKNIRAARNLL